MKEQKATNSYEKLTEGYEKFIKGKKLNPNGKGDFKKVLKK